MGLERAGRQSMASSEKMRNFTEQDNARSTKIIVMLEGEEGELPGGEGLREERTTKTESTWKAVYTKEQPCRRSQQNNDLK